VDRRHFTAGEAPDFMSGPCSRRDALRLGGLLAGASVAGCLGGDGSARTTTATRMTTATTTTAEQVEANVTVGESVTLPDGTDLAVADAWVQQSVVHRVSHHEVTALADRQFVLAHVAAEVGYDGFALDVDGDAYPASHEAAGVALDGVRVEGRETEPLLLGWAVPKPLDATEVAVVYERENAAVRWTAGSDVAATLSAPPEFAVREFTAPESVVPDEPFEVAVTVENAGGSDGTFRASLGLADRSDYPELRLDVPAGERATHAESHSLSADEGSATFALDWGLDSMERTVTVEE
jgi:hypothetical protein